MLITLYPLDERYLQHQHLYVDPLDSLQFWLYFDTLLPLLRLVDAAQCPRRCRQQKPYRLLQFT
jgi:hypothetical protein